MNGHIAKRYAKALFEVVTEPSARDQANAALVRFQEALEVRDPDTGLSIGAMAAARNVSLDTRKSLVNALGKRMELPKDVLSFVGILAQRGRLSGIQLVTRHFRELCDAAQGRIRVRLRTASALAPEQEARIRSALSSATGQEVLLETQVDPELIGGLVVHFKSLTVDRSVRRSLDEIRETFSVSARSAGAQV